MAGIYWTLLGLYTLFNLPATTEGVACGQSLTGSSGVLTSYNFPFDYRHNLSCTYRLVLGPPSGPRTVCFTFRRFALERSTPFCSFDYVRFENIKYCGGGLWQYGRQTTEAESNVWNKHFCWPAKKNHFDISFMSDNNLNGAGFYAEYHVLPGPPPSHTDSVVDTGYAPCSDQQWTCFNRRCVNTTLLCDGRDDCGDGTDESYAHARCPQKSVLACDFSSDSVPSDGQCGFVQQDGQWFRTNKALSHGPRADHTNGTEGYFMYTDSDHSPAYLVSPELTLPSGHSAYCMSFWYYMYGRPAAALLNVFLGRVVTYNKPEWSRLNAQPDKWLRGEVTIQGDQPLQVTFGAVLDNSFSGVALDDISVTPGACHQGDISCNFETSLCGWQSVGDAGGLHGNLTWERHNRLRSAAGPMEDHSSTDGSGMYLLVRSPPARSSPHPRALLVSPPVSAPAPSPRCLRFWYHLTGRGDDSAVLRVRLALSGGSGELTSARWAQNARFQNGWRQMALQVAEDKPYQVVIEATLDGVTGEIAIDEVVLDNNACPEIDSGACAGGEFLCGDGSCVPAVHRCDGITHCKDGSDEDWRAACPRTTTEAPTTVCPQDYFQCVSDGRCVPVKWVCDNFRDCADGSDESHVAKCEGVSPQPLDGSSSRSPCGSGHFACSDGACLQVAARCDGERHCDDGSDETNCTFGTGSSTPPSVVCGAGMFQCVTGGQCLTKVLVCDGQAHCADGSDEDSSSAHCARPINTAGLGTTAAIALALSLVVALTVIILPVVLCRRRKARQREVRDRGHGRPETPDTVTPDISTISYGDDTSLSRPLEDSLRRVCTSSYRPGRRDGRIVNPVNEFQQHIEQMDDHHRQSCIENLERYMINPRRAQPLPPVPPPLDSLGNGRHERRGSDLVDPNEYILALRSAPLHPPPYSIRDYQNLQYIPDGVTETEDADAPSSSGVYSLPPDDPPPPYDGMKDADHSASRESVVPPSRTLPGRGSGRTGVASPRGMTHTLPPYQISQGHEGMVPHSSTGDPTPYHVTPVHQVVPESGSLNNTFSSHSSLDNLISAHHTPSSSLSLRHAPNNIIAPQRNTNNVPPQHSPSSTTTPKHTPGSRMSPHAHHQHIQSNTSSLYNPHRTSSPHHTPTHSLSPHHTPTHSLSPHHTPNSSMSSQHSSSRPHQNPPAQYAHRHHPLYPRLGTQRAPNAHAARPTPMLHLSSPHSPPSTTTPHQQLSPAQSPRDPALPASHQLHQVQLQFLPSSSV